MHVRKIPPPGLSATMIKRTVAFLVIVSCGLALRRAAAHDQDLPTSQQAVSAHPASPTTPTPAPQPPPLALPGMLLADVSVDIYAKASGFVSSVTVDIGSEVTKGDVLAELDIPETAAELRHAEAMLAAKVAHVEALSAKVDQARLAVESARADLHRATAERELSRITCERKTDLHTEKAIPDQEFDEAKSKLAIADAQVLMAQARLAGAEGDTRASQADVGAAEAEVKVADADIARLLTLITYATITAPFDGIIASRNVDPGALVRSSAQAAGPALFVLKKIDRLRLAIDVPEDLAPLIHVGAEVEVCVGGEAPFSVQVSRRAQAIRADTRTMRVEADIANQQGRLLPGMYARVTIRLPATAIPKPGG